MVDSLFLQYDKNLQSMPEQQKKMLVGKVERHNVVANILESAQQNVKFLESTQLTGKDLAGMIKEQRQFSANWKGLGPKLAAVYINSKERAKQIAAVDSVIAEWGRKADSALWTGLNNEFTSKEISIQPFHSGDEFVANLGNYFDAQTSDTKTSSDERTVRLNNFLDHVWNPSVGSQWLPMLVDEGIVTKDQQTQLQTKLAAWEASTQPSHTLLYIIILVVVVIVIFVIATTRRKKAPPSEATPQG